ncbi:MAG: hypothetical protein VYD19_09910 [Myxococcota bacterium]|nr:hypothetical protein [Myxococcota bacterium]
MKRIARALSQSRRSRLLVALLLISINSMGLDQALGYVEVDCKEPLFAHLILVAGLALSALLMALLIISISPELIGGEILKGLSQDRSAAFDKKLDAAEAEFLREEAERKAALAGGNGGTLLDHRVSAIEEESSLVSESTAALETASRVEIDDEFEGSLFNPWPRFRVWFLGALILQLLSVDQWRGGFLSRYRQSGEALLYLRSENLETRLMGVELATQRLISSVSLGASAPPPLIAGLYQTLESAETPEALQLAILEALSLLRAEPVAAQLGRWLVEQTPPLKRAAILSLGEMGRGQVEESPSMKTLRQLLQEPTLQKEALEALAFAAAAQRLNGASVLRPALEARLLIARAPGATEDPALLRERIALLWALIPLRDEALLPVFEGALSDPAVELRCLAAYGLEKMVSLWSSEMLQRALIDASPEQRCPALSRPEIPPYAARHLVSERHYQLALLRALATTDDPRLISWLYDEQERVQAPMSKRFMKRLYDQLREREARGALDYNRRAIKARGAQGGSK